MSRISFPIKEVNKLIVEIKVAKEFNPNYDQTLESKYYKKGTKPTPADWPTNQKDIDKTKIPKGFWLVKDNSVYLMSNANGKQKVDDRYQTVYAKGFDPDVNEGWYDDARHLLGGDDFSVFIPLDWYEDLIKRKPNARMFAINITDTSVGLAN